MGVSLITLISMLLVGAGVLLVRWRSYLFGKTVEKAKAQEKTLEAIKDGNDAQERIVFDADERKRVRDKYDK